MTALSIRTEPGKRIALIVLLAMTAIGVSLRFDQLDAQCLWMDEIATLELARSVRTHGILQVAQEDHIAPLYIWMTQIAISTGSETAFWLRLPSAIAGCLTIPLMYLLTLRMFRSQSLGLIAAGLMAISPFAIWYAQEARMYSLMLLLSMVLVEQSWAVLEGDARTRTRLSLCLVGMMGLYTHHYMALIIAAMGCFMLAYVGWRDRRFHAWLVSQVIAVLAFLPWMLLTISRLDASAGTAKPLMLFWLPYTFFTFASGFSLGPSVGDLRLQGAIAAMRQHWLIIVSAAVSTVTVAAIGLRTLWQADTRQQAGRCCIFWLAVPMLLAVLATFVTNISFNVRYVMGVYPAFVLILATGIHEVPRSALARFGALGFAMVTVMALQNAYGNPHYAKADVRPVASLLAEEKIAIVVMDNERIGPILQYYGVRCTKEVIRICPETPNGVGEAIRLIDYRQLQSGEAIWLIEYRTWESDPDRLLRAHLASIAEEVSVREWPGVTLRVYRVR